MAKKQKVLTVGGSTQDIYLQYQGSDWMRLMESGGERSYMLFESGKKVEVGDILHHTGGGSTNSAVSFKRLGLESSCFCMIGDDFAGKAVLDDLNQEGVDTSNIVVSKEHPSGMSYVVNSLQRDSVVFAHRGVNGHMQKSDIPFAAIKDIDQLYITSLSQKSSALLQDIAVYAKKQNISVAINPGISQLSAGVQDLKKSLAYIDILILNSSEAKTFMGALVERDQRYQKAFESSVDLKSLAAAVDTINGKNPKEPHLLTMPLHHKNLYFSLPNFFKEVMKMGPEIVVVTDGARGVYVAQGKRVLFHPSLSVKVIDTLGAGDSFGSCFVASLQRGATLERALQNGIINSASVIGQFGAKPGLLSYEAIEEKISSVSAGMLQSYEL